jgi:NADP-dependent 3-hydroxy acid dehydrogenase YdfG
MSKTIAIFGAGTGLGISTARRFGRENYQVALIGRRPHALGTLVDQLTEEGIRLEAGIVAQPSSNGVASITLSRLSVEQTASSTR